MRLRDELEGGFDAERVVQIDQVGAQLAPRGTFDVVRHHRRSASAPSGQNQMNGTASICWSCSTRAIADRISVSTLTSTGQRGNWIALHPRSRTCCRCFLTGTGSTGRRR